MKMQVNHNWSFKESVIFIDGIKATYEDTMLFFYLTRNKKRVLDQARKIKESIYNLKFEEWKRDKLWEYINGDIARNDLWDLI